MVLSVCNKYPSPVLELKCNTGATYEIEFDEHMCIVSIWSSRMDCVWDLVITNDFQLSKEYWTIEAVDRKKTAMNEVLSEFRADINEQTNRDY